MRAKGIKPKVVLRGQLSNFWKGGVNERNKTLYRLVRDLKEYAEWRKSVMKRDEYTCQNCGQRGGKLEVDHSPFAFSVILNTFLDLKRPEQAIGLPFLWDIENGRTLCKICHLKYGNKNFNKTGRTLFEAFPGN